jgi:hypothetical protein
VTCRQCNTKMPDSWRAFLVGRHAFCGKECGTKFALAEVPRLEAHLSNISKKAKGVGRDLAVQALYSNQDPP